MKPKCDVCLYIGTIEENCCYQLEHKRDIYDLQDEINRMSTIHE